MGGIESVREESRFRVEGGKQQRAKGTAACHWCL